MVLALTGCVNYLGSQAMPRKI